MANGMLAGADPGTANDPRAEAVVEGMEKDALVEEIGGGSEKEDLVEGVTANDPRPVRAVTNDSPREEPSEKEPFLSLLGRAGTAGVSPESVSEPRPAHPVFLGVSSSSCIAMCDNAALLFFARQLCYPSKTEIDRTALTLQHDGCDTSRSGKR